MNQQRTWIAKHPLNREIEREREKGKGVVWDGRYTSWRRNPVPASRHHGGRDVLLFWGRLRQLLAMET